MLLKKIGIVFLVKFGLCISMVAAATLQEGDGSTDSAWSYLRQDPPPGKSSVLSPPPFPFNEESSAPPSGRLPKTPPKSPVGKTPQDVFLCDRGGHRSSSPAPATVQAAVLMGESCLPVGSAGRAALTSLYPPPLIYDGNGDARLSLPVTPLKRPPFSAPTRRPIFPSLYDRDDAIEVLQTRSASTSFAEVVADPNDLIVR